ncbi:MAG: M50 family metallopeptidase [Pseudomonadota bacterium]
MSPPLTLPDKPRLVADIAIARPVAARGASYVLSNLTTGRHLRLTAEAYRFASKLDGTTSISGLAAQTEVDGGQTSEFALEVTKSLAAAGFIEGTEWSTAKTSNHTPEPLGTKDDLPSENHDTEESSVSNGLKKLERLAVTSRHPLLDAQPILHAISPVTNLLFSKAGSLAWLVLMIVAAQCFFGMENGATHPLTWLAQATPIELLALSCAVLASKAIHELGHAAALSQFSLHEGIDPGPVHVGITRFFIFPLPYTDASAAWRIASKWRRAAIGLSGIYFETLLAFLAIILAASMPVGVVQTLLLQFAFVAAVSTLAFNLNPFVKLDGYFVLTDLIGQPNLAPRAMKAFSRVSATLLTKTNNLAQEHSGIEGSDLVLSIFALGNLIFRLAISVGVTAAAATISTGLATSILLISISIMMARPFARFVETLKGKSFRRTACVAFVSLVALLFVPVHDQIHAPGLVEAPHLQRFLAASGGTVSSVTTSTVRFENPALSFEEKSLTAREAIAKIRLRQALKTANPDAIRIQQNLAHTEDALARVHAEQASLTFTAHNGNKVDTQLASQLVGQTVPPNQPVGVSYAQDTLLVRAILNQKQIQRLSPTEANALVTEVWRKKSVSPLSATAQTNSINRLITFPSAALTRAAGGPFEIKTTAEKRLEPVSSVFSMELDLAQPSSHTLKDGEIVSVRITLGSIRLGEIAMRNALTGFQNLIGINTYDD